MSAHFFIFFFSTYCWFVNYRYTRLLFADDNENMLGEGIGCLIFARLQYIYTDIDVYLRRYADAQMHRHTRIQPVCLFIIWFWSLILTAKTRAQDAIKRVHFPFSFFFFFPEEAKKREKGNCRAFF